MWENMVAAQVELRTMRVDVGVDLDLTKSFGRFLPIPGSQDVSIVPLDGECYFHL